MNISHSKVHGPILFHGKIGPLLKSPWGGVSKSCDCMFGIERSKKGEPQRTIYFPVQQL